MQPANRTSANLTGMLRIFALSLLFSAANTQADVVTEWNIKAAEIASKLPGPPPGGVRVMALTQVAVFEAVNAIMRRHPPSPIFRTPLDAAPEASLDAAVAAATRGILIKTVPTQLVETEIAYQFALGALPDGAAKLAGIALGEKSAAAVLALRTGDATP
ncbi:MAG: hypothetical protein ABL931_01275, partial [Usitatibacteraceae bacterium]